MFRTSANVLILPPPTRAGYPRLLLDHFLVLLGRKEAALAGDPEPEDPTLTVGILADPLRGIVQRAVDLDDLAAHRGIEIIDALDGPDGAESVAGLKGCAFLGQLEVAIWPTCC